MYSTEKMRNAINGTLEHAQSASEKLAEDAGYDAAVNGSNTANSHFKWFMAPHLTKALERGKARGEQFAAGDADREIK